MNLPLMCTILMNLNTQLRVVVCYLRVHKLRHNVQDSLVPFSTAGVIIKQRFTPFSKAQIAQIK